jgi:hypothetical protein
MDSSPVDQAVRRSLQLDVRQQRTALVQVRFALCTCLAVSFHILIITPAYCLTASATSSCTSSCRGKPPLNANSKSTDH